MLFSSGGGRQCPCAALLSLTKRIALAACLGVLVGSSLAAEEKVGNEVLAVVNGMPITRQEVELVFKRTVLPSMTPELAATRRRAILAELVRTEAMAQQAVAKGLKDEEQLALETRLAHRQSLASRAEKAAGDELPPILAEEARNFVSANPLLFAQRKQYTLEEVQLLTSDPMLFKKLDEAVKRTDADLDRAQRMAVEAGAATQRRVFATQSEALPQPLVVPLANARVGQVFVLQYGADRGALLAVKAAVAAPLTGEVAAQAAIGLATEFRRRQSTLQRSQDAVNKARITYTEAATAMSAPAVAAAASAPPEPAPAASAASAPTGPVVVAAERLADLPLGLTESPRRVLARKLAIVCGTLLVGLGGLLALVATVRHGFERFWLPKLWPLRAPVETPALLRIVAEALVHPSTARMAWSEIGLRIMVLAGLLVCCIVPVMAFSAGMRHMPAWVLGCGLAAGWLGGIVASHLLARKRLNAGPPTYRALPVFGYQALILVVCGLGVRFL